MAGCKERAGAASLPKSTSWELAVHVERHTSRLASAISDTGTMGTHVRRHGRQARVAFLHANERERHPFWSPKKNPADATHGIASGRRTPNA